MTTLAFITLNSVLGVTVVYGLLRLLTHGASSDRASRKAGVVVMSEQVAERLAA